MLKINTPIRVAHPFAHFAKGWGIARSATVLLCIALGLSVARAQSSCSLSAIKSSGPLAYPRIATAARVYGDVTLLAVFAAEGSVVSVHTAAGPVMLQKAANDYVTGWHVNDGQGEQECLITISFRIEGDPICSFGPSIVKITNLEHFCVSVAPLQTCDTSTDDPAYINHRFLFLHWHSIPRNQVA